MTPGFLRRLASFSLLVSSCGSALAQGEPPSVEDLGSVFDVRSEPRPARSGEVLRVVLPGTGTSRVVALDAGGGQVLWSHEGPELHAPLARPSVARLGRRAFRLASSSGRGRVLYEAIDSATGWPVGPPTPMRLVAGLERLPLDEPVAFGDRILLPVWTDRESAELYAARFEPGANEPRDEEVLSLRVARHPTFASEEAPVHFVSALHAVRGGVRGGRASLGVVAASGARRALVVFLADPLEIERVVDLPVPGSVVGLDLVRRPLGAGVMELDAWVATAEEGRVRHARYDAQRGRFVQVLDLRGEHLAGPLTDPEGETWFATAAPGCTDVTRFRADQAGYAGETARLPVRHGWPLPLRSATGARSLAVVHRHGVTPIGFDPEGIRLLDAGLVAALRTPSWEEGHDAWFEAQDGRAAFLEPLPTDSADGREVLGVRTEGGAAVISRLREATDGTGWRLAWETKLGEPRGLELASWDRGFLVHTHGRLTQIEERGLGRSLRTLPVGAPVEGFHVLRDGRVVALADAFVLFDALGTLLSRAANPLGTEGGYTAFLETDGEVQVVRLGPNGDAWTGWTTGRTLQGASWRLGDSVRGAGSIDAAAAFGPFLYLAAGDQVFRLRLSLEDGRPFAWDVFSVRSFLGGAEDVAVVDRLLPHADGVVAALRSVGPRRWLSIGFEADRPVFRARLTEAQRGDRYAIVDGRIFRFERDVRWAALRATREGGDEEFVPLDGAEAGRLGASAVDGAALYFQVRSREGVFLQRVEGARARTIARSTRLAERMIVSGDRLLGADAHGQIFRMRVR